MRRAKLWLWIGWVATTMMMAGYYTYRWNGNDRTIFLPGRTSHGHYQIELACNACHTPWMGVKEKACHDCHAAELKLANDSHPKSKFTDPRNADRLKLIQADNCVTCHREHVPEQTRAMGVTLPDDFCTHCHQDTLTERPSHKNYPFNSCANAGCHNYHDNTALYEDFLSKHLRESATRDSASVARRDLLAYLTQTGEIKPRPLGAAHHDAPGEPPVAMRVVEDWAATAHAKAGVNCTGCHTITDRVTKSARWSDRLDHTACAKCHAEESQGFLAGRHGMRLAQGLSPMQPGMARLLMKPEASHRELNCSSCHGAHVFDTRRAAVDSCLSCHDDPHSLAYQSSRHFALWQAEVKGEGPAGSGVSCATCHLPREVHKVDGVTWVLVQHNQNFNLRPNEKMIRSVCLSCHDLGFTIDALADRALIQTNFAGQPARHIESLDLVARRQAETRTKNLNTLKP
jgi:hypothetical protein